MHLIDLLPDKRWYRVTASYDALRLPENKVKVSVRPGDKPSILTDSSDWAAGLWLTQQSACSAGGSLAFHAQHHRDHASWCRSVILALEKQKQEGHKFCYIVSCRPAWSGSEDPSPPAKAIGVADYINQPSLPRGRVIFPVPTRKPIPHAVL